jgi:hypothetical protein
MTCQLRFHRVLYYSHHGSRAQRRRRDPHPQRCRGGWGLAALRCRGVRLARYAGGESTRRRRVLQHHFGRHRGGTGARVYADRPHPNADLECRAQRHCRCSDHDGHDGGRYAPFGYGSLQCPADTYFFRMGWNSADGHYRRCTALVLDWLTRALIASVPDGEADLIERNSRPAQKHDMGSMPSHTIGLG